MTPTLEQLNALTDAGIISDNAVTWADVAPCDQERALAWLELHGLQAISVKQPWAWLIIHGGKDIENRNWLTRIRGRVLIHASKGMTRDEYAEAFDLFDEIETSGKVAIPSFEELQRGGIVGSVEIVDCVTHSKSPWFFGEYGFVLKDPRAIPFTPCRGALSFFRPEYSQPEQQKTSVQEELM